MRYFPPRHCQSLHDPPPLPGPGLYNAGWDLDAQSVTSAPLELGNTIPDKMEGSVLKALKGNLDYYSGHLTFGSAGARHVLPALADHGMYAEAMDMMTKRSFPSFGYWMANGATTCWENWSGVADPR